MPSSHFYQLDQISGIIFNLNPKSVLDVGVGFGKYGLLTREYVDVWRDGNYKHFKRRLDGIEIYKSYLNPMHKFLYNNIYLGNAKDIIPKLKIKYDLVLLIDVIEHFSKKEGDILLKKLLKISNFILVSTPRKMLQQAEVFGNVYETHIHQWKEEELIKNSEAYFFKNDRSIICLLGSNSKEEGRYITREKLYDRLTAKFPTLTSLLRNNFYRII